MNLRPSVRQLIVFSIFTLGSPVLAEGVSPPGFEKIFDGESLKGWHAMPEDGLSDWSVKDGVLVAKGSQDKLVYLMFDEKLDNFELKLKYRMVTKGNTGVEIRCRPDTTGKRPIEGYHADLGHVGIGPQILGAWDFHFAKREEYACFRGMKLTIDEDSKTTTERDPQAVRISDINQFGWNDLHVEARGKLCRFSINGKLAAEFTDEMPERFIKGWMGLQIHDAGMIVEYKDIFLKRQAENLVTKKPNAKKPNIVLIFTDDQGYQDVGCFGSPNIKTPNLDKMAAEGMRMTSFYSMAPICSASRAGLLTGCYPPRVGTTGVYFPNHDVGLNPKEVTIAEVLRDVGYATACVGKWHLGHHPEFLPTSQGFDRYFGIPYSNDMDKKKGQKNDLDNAWKNRDFSKWNVPLMRDTEIIERPANQTTLTKRYTEEAVKFIRESKNQPFFLYMPQTMPHIPLFASPEFYTGDPKDAYQACIEEIDWSVGKVLSTLKELGLDDNTIVVYTSDNGPWLNLKPPHHGGSALPLRAGKFTTFEGGMRVPAIFRMPGRIKAGTESDEVAAAFDLLPTFASLAGAKLDTDRTIDGENIWPLLSGATESSPHDEFYYFRGGGRIQAVRRGKWKLHLERGRGKGENRKVTSPVALYDLDTDISESNNLASQHEDLVRELTETTNAFVAKLKEEQRPEGKLMVAEVP